VTFHSVASISDMARRAQPLLAVLTLLLIGTMVSALEVQRGRALTYRVFRGRSSSRVLLRSGDHSSRWVLQRLRGGAAAALTLPPLLHHYRGALIAAPICTNVISAAGLSLTADGMTQMLERRMSKRVEAPRATWDWGRSAWITVWGASISGYMLFFWFRLLAYLFPQAATSGTQLVLKVALNQVVMSPTLNAGFFSFVIWTRVEPRLRFNGAKRATLLNKLKTDLPQTIRRSCYFWGVAQTINFRFMPRLSRTGCVPYAD
jgi:hypothetical protein